MIGVYYRPPDQGEAVDEAFLLQMREALCSWALVLVGLINTCNGMEMPAEEGKGHREWGHRVCTPRMCPSLLTCSWAFNEKMRAMLEP